MSTTVVSSDQVKHLQSRKCEISQADQAGGLAGARPWSMAADGLCAAALRSFVDVTVTSMRARGFGSFGVQNDVRHEHPGAMSHISSATRGIPGASARRLGCPPAAKGQALHRARNSLPLSAAATAMTYRCDSRRLSECRALT